MTAVSLLWLIPVLPLLGAFVNGVFGWKWETDQRNVISAVALGSTALSLVLALWNIFTLWSTNWARWPACRRTSRRTRCTTASRCTWRRGCPWGTSRRGWGRRGTSALDVALRAGPAVAR